MAHLPSTPGLTPRAFKAAIEAGCVVNRHAVDERLWRRPHRRGVNIGAQPELSVWAGEMLDPDRPLLLVLEDDEALPDVLRLFLPSRIWPVTW